MIRTKREMYALLARGEFGNTIPQWFADKADDLVEWAYFASPCPFWGVRTLTPGGPCRLNCPAEEVCGTAESFLADGHKVNISMMVDRVATVTLWGDVWDSPTGLVVYGIEYPDTSRLTWRTGMPTLGSHWEGIAARHLLARHLNANSLEDLAAVFERWPGHVCELSALDRSLGTVPHRNAVVWEVRLY